MASIKNVYKLCKTLSKSPCILHAKLSVKNLTNPNLVQNFIYSPAFSILSTSFPTASPSLFHSLFIHYSTDPTTNTTINNLIERRKKNEN